jgi:CDP-diglyceride synthetase
MTPAVASALMATAIAFGLGAAVIFIASLLPFGRRMAGELWSLYRLEFLIVGAVLLPAAAGPWPFALLLLALEIRGLVEWFELFGAGSRPGAALGSMVFPTAFIFLTGLLRFRPDGFAWIFLAYATVEMGDAFALVTGKLVGRRRPLPRLSPNKTVAGFVASLVVGGATGFLIARHILKLAAPSALLAVLVIFASGVAGDLAISAIKRRRGRKDFKPVMARHGGVLDIYDSFLFAAPALLALRSAIQL